MKKAGDTDLSRGKLPITATREQRSKYAHFFSRTDERFVVNLWTEPVLREKKLNYRNGL